MPHNVEPFKKLHARSNEPDSVLSVGGELVVDPIDDHGDNVASIEDEKDDSIDSGASPGGGATNFARALDSMYEFFEEPSDINLVGSKGNCPSPEKFEDIRYYLRVFGAHAMLDEFLRLKGMLLYDMKKGMDNVAKLNPTTQWDGKRHISKQSSNMHVRLSHQTKYAQGALHSATTSARGSKLIFLDPKDLELCAAIVKEADDKGGILTITDYGAKEWPKNEKDAKNLKTLLSTANVIFLPKEAVVEGMEDNKKDPETLFEKVKNEYAPDILIMSGDTDPVKVYLKETDELFEIPVAPAIETRFKSVIGDTRDAIFAYFSLKGNDPITALRKAMAVVRVKLAYPDMDWRKHLDELREDPLFKEDFKALDQRRIRKWENSEIQKTFNDQNIKFSHIKDPFNEHRNVAAYKTFSSNPNIDDEELAISLIPDERARKMVKLHKAMDEIEAENKSLPEQLYPSLSFAA